MLAELPPDMDGEAATPASSHLFDVNVDNPVALCKEKADFFHHDVATLLFLCKRARPDIQTAVAFLCTRVKEPDVDDYKKLSRVMKYLRATGNMALTIQADNMHVVKWWVDASFAVHRDLKSHTGGMMTLGKGATYATSTRQRITNDKFNGSRDCRNSRGLTTSVMDKILFGVTRLWGGRIDYPSGQSKRDSTCKEWTRVKQ